MSLIELEKFIELGYYEQLKSLIKHADTLKQLVRDELEDQEIERYVWEEYGVVGKFRIVKRYKYDHNSLKEYLFDLGILPVKSSIKPELLHDDEEDLLEEVKSSRDQLEKPMRFFPKKILQEKVLQVTSERALRLDQLSTSECVYLWREYKRLIDKLEKQWNTILTTIRRSFNDKE